jgi:hypothetical protein
VGFRICVSERKLIFYENKAEHRPTLQARDIFLLSPCSKYREKKLKKTRYSLSLFYPFPSLFFFVKVTNARM